MHLQIRRVQAWSGEISDRPGAAAAKQPGEEAYMIRMLACEGPDAKMEVYIPQSIATNDAALARSVIGYYTLDLTGADKGKLLERPVDITPAEPGGINRNGGRLTVSSR